MPMTISESVKSDDTRKWCFLESRDAEVAFGPYDSREAAIAEARKRDLESIVLSRCNFADPGECELFDGEQDILEKMDEATCETLRNPEEPTYSLKTSAKVVDLKDIIAKWLRENVSTDWFSCDPDAFEDVDLRDVASESKPCR